MTIGEQNRLSKAMVPSSIPVAPTTITANNYHIEYNFKHKKLVQLNLTLTNAGCPAKMQTSGVSNLKNLFTIGTIHFF